jgi:hypothetical protein
MATARRPGNEVWAAAALATAIMWTIAIRENDREFGVVLRGERSPFDRCCASTAAFDEGATGECFVSTGSCQLRRALGPCPGDEAPLTTDPAKCCREDGARLRDLLAMYLERHGRWECDVGAVSSDVGMQRLACAPWRAC